MPATQQSPRPSRSSMPPPPPSRPSTELPRPVPLVRPRGGRHIEVVSATADDPMQEICEALAHTEDGKTDPLVVKAAENVLLVAKTSASDLDPVASQFIDAALPRVRLLKNGSRHQVTSAIEAAVKRLSGQLNLNEKAALRDRLNAVSLNDIADKHLGSITQARDKRPAGISQACV